MRGFTLDAGGLIAVEKEDRRVLALIRAATADKDRIVIPATALAQVLRNPAKQVRLWRMMQHKQTDVVPLDGSYAQAIGALLAKSGTSDIVDAHVVICARRAGQAVITSDPFDLKRLDSTLRIVSV